jgi:1,4-alpha-glucan branching enzyme
MNIPLAIQPIAERFPAMERQEVMLTFYAPEAHMVEVAGSFNGWHPQANPLERTAAGEWTTRLMLRSGRYEYRYVVDGAWTDDPQAMLGSPNPFAGSNAVLLVGLDDRTDLL